MKNNQMSHMESQRDAPCDRTRDGQRESHMESHLPRPDQTRPEVLYLTDLVVIGNPFPNRYLSDATSFERWGWGC